MALFGFVSVRRLLLALAQRHTVHEVLDIATKTLAASSGVALVRVWLLGQGDRCLTCRFEPSCPDKEKCLHLMSSAGRSNYDNITWDNINGAFSRFPLGIGKVGQIAQEGMPVEIADLDPEAPWVIEPDWIRREGVQSFAGQPLVCRDEVLGVLSVFTRERLEQGALDMLRMVADHLAYAIANAHAFETITKLKKQIEEENAYLREEIKEAQSFYGIIGKSQGVEYIRKLIQVVAPTDANVLIYGESGTGKEMIARAIHNYSSRCNMPMIKINCSAIPRELFESEFFGHARGAFTGAVKNRIGFFQSADGGTLFLDEVGELPIFLQSKLLRVLQEGEYKRVGEDNIRTVNVRVISATNRDLISAIQSGQFREDLYYRLQVFPLEIPPLRERKDDIPLLAKHFIKLCSQKFNKPATRLNSAHMLRLIQHDWPGNIRELQNIIERIVITSQPEQVLQELQRLYAAENKKNAFAVMQPERSQLLTEHELRELEKENMREALRRTNWKIYGPRGAAKLLSVNPTTLISRLKKLGIYKV
ncbi:MAG: sigma 54-interacting transcriptional regulator [Desulfovibrio sp.]|jgi:transcriptional regulator with GAF, ATPase, and Fis domain|nr:sigma 54-interacting transcriptional regulator [Desulfovibrio sp.]